MGMFDWIEDKLYCPFCGKKQDGFQSKDMECLGNNWTIKDIIKFQPDDINIYTECVKCKKWISINLETWRLLSKFNNLK